MLSPDERTVLYSAWRQLRADDPALPWSRQGIAHGDALGEPSVRRLDLLTGRDEQYVAGAHSPMISSSGAVAYVRGVDRVYRAGVPYVGRIEVRASFDAVPVVWTPHAKKYAIAAWAGSRLLAYEIGEGEALSPVVLDGPGRVRSLSGDAAIVPAANSRARRVSHVGDARTLVAVSPDGEFAFLERSNRLPVSVAVVRIADGHVRSSLTLPERLGVRALSYAGDWLGSSVVVRTDSGLAFFDVRHYRIAFGGAIRLDRVRFPDGAVQPRFTDGGSRVVAFANEADASGATHSVALVCSRATTSCTAIPMEGAGAQPAFDPSAPGTRTPAGRSSRRETGHA